MTLHARTPKGRLMRRLLNLAPILLPLVSAVSCGLVTPSPGPPSLLAPGPDIPSADDGGGLSDGGLFPGTGGASAGTGGGPGCLPSAPYECRGAELWEVTNSIWCAPTSTLLEVCVGGCVTSPSGLAACAGAGGMGGYGGGGGAAGAAGLP